MFKKDVNNKKDVLNKKDVPQAMRTMGANESPHKKGRRLLHRHPLYSDEMLYLYVTLHDSAVSMT